MISTFHRRWCRVVLILFLGAIPVLADETPELKSAEPDANLILLKKFAEEQREFLQRTQTRLHEVSAQANKNSEIILQRVQQLELSLTEQKKHEVQLQQEFNRTFLVCLVVFALLAVAGLTILSFTIMATARRTGEVITALASATRQLPMPLPLGGIPGVSNLPSTQRFVEAMSRLEARLEQVEKANVLPP